MGRFLAFLGGIVAGAAIGAGVTLLFTPASGSDLIRSAEERWDMAISEGKRAKDEKQRELEQQLDLAKQP